MTALEQTTVNKLSFRQGAMESNLKDLSDDVIEIKLDIKEIKALLTQSSDTYVSKKFVKYVIGLALSVGTLWVLFLNYIHHVK